MNRNYQHKKSWRRQDRPERCDGMARREALTIGGLTALGLGLSRFFSLQAYASSETALSTSRIAGVKPPRSGTAQSCVLIWLDGGPSHLETFDPKPEAPKDIRGPLSTIKTRLSGIHFNECLPELANRIKDLAIIRSMTSTLGEHNFGTHYMMSGFKPSPALEYPSFHAVGASTYDRLSTLPLNIAIPNWRVGGGKFTGSGYLDSSVAPFSVGGNPAKPNFRVRDLDLGHGMTLDRVQRRREFVKQLEKFAQLDDGPSDPAFEQAFRMVTSSEARRAFALHEEPEQVRRRYGRNTTGQSCLLARRLIERGVRFVTVNAGGWDTHADLAVRLKDGYSGARKPVGLVPTLDNSCSALLDDLRDRGLLEETLIVIMGEFGRTPKLNAAGGRDHWPRAFSVALAGGGVRGGQVIGASDSSGESPRDRPITPSDLVASIYKLLGIDPALELKTADGRPVRITPADCNPIDELWS